MKIAVIALHLNDPYDAVFRDVVEQVKTLAELVGKANINLFAETFEAAVYEGMECGDVAAFDTWCSAHPQGIVIFHYCDSRNSFDKKLRMLQQSVIVRWHNNTPPWFNLDNSQGVHAQIGYENIVEYILSPHVRFWANSQFTARQLRALGCSPGRVDVVFPASRFLDLPVSPASQPSMESENGFSLLFVGRVVPHKGHLNAIATALALRRHSGSAVRLHFVGRRDYGMPQFNRFFDEAVEQASGEIEIDLRGQVTHEALSRLYRESTAFLCLSEHEGFGLPTVEAVRSGLPVVVWANTALAELFANHPFAFDYFDKDVFAASIASLRDPDVRKFVADAQTAVLDFYNREVLNEQTKQALERLVKPSDQIRLKGAELDIAKAVLAEFSDLQRKFPDPDCTTVHDSGANMVSQLDLRQYRHHLEARTALRFASLTPPSRRKVFIQPMEQSLRGGTLSDNAVVWTLDREDGCFVWGPYTELPVGSYIARFHLQSLGVRARGAICAEVHCSRGTVARKITSANELLKGKSIYLPFVVSPDSGLFEFRLNATASFRGTLKLEGVSLWNGQVALPMPKDHLARDVTFFPPLLPGLNGDERRNAGLSVMISSPAAGGDTQYSQEIALPEGEYQLQLQLSYSREAQKLVSVKIARGPDTLALAERPVATLKDFQPLCLALTIKESCQAILYISVADANDLVLEYGGAHLASISRSGPRLPGLLRYLPAAALRLCAQTSAKRGHYSAASFLYRALSKKRVAKSADWIQFGHALKEAGDWLQAEQAYYRALALCPDDVETRLHLAHLCLMIDRRARARHFFRRLAADGPHMDEAARLLTILEEDGCGGELQTAQDKERK